MAVKFSSIIKVFIGNNFVFSFIRPLKSYLMIKYVSIKYLIEIIEKSYFLIYW